MIIDLSLFQEDPETTMPQEKKTGEALAAERHALERGNGRLSMTAPTNTSPGTRHVDGPGIEHIYSRVNAYRKHKVK